LPPDYLWEDPQGLEQWWKKVKDKHSDGRDEVAGSRRSSEDDDDEHPDPGMAENDIARYLKD
jgi:hypothetical protein